MKTIYLLRHAKSSWDDLALADYDRPLAPRGRKAAPRMAAWMRRAGMQPDRVLCSSAVRARQTWELVAEAFAVPPPVEYREALYDAGAEELIAALRGLPDDTAAAMLVGHNPAMETAAARLAGGGDEAAMKRMAAKYPTAALAEIAFDADTWADIGPGSGRLVRFVRPKDLD